MQRYTGAVQGMQQILGSKLTKDHIVQVQSDGTETGTYNNAVSALSQIPSNAVVMMTGVNDEVVHGMYKAAQARHIKNYLVISFGGDPFGLAQVCADRTHYVGALYLLPKIWGSSALSVMLDQLNGKTPSEAGRHQGQDRHGEVARRRAASRIAAIRNRAAGAGGEHLRPPRGASGSRGRNFRTIGICRVAS